MLPSADVSIGAMPAADVEAAAIAAPQPVGKRASRRQRGKVSEKPGTPEAEEDETP